jgi:hypothetical protein
MILSGRAPLRNAPATEEKKNYKLQISNKHGEVACAIEIFEICNP